MFERPQARRYRPAQTAVSLLIHAALLFGVIRGLHSAHAVLVLMPGTSKGARIDLIYNPGRAPVPTLRQNQDKPTPTASPILKAAPAIETPVENAALAELAHPHLPPLHQTSPVTDSPPSPTPDTNAGSDSFGSGDVQIALTTYSPSPKPDLSTLPHGTQGDVILDITIDPTGKVADLQMLQGLGHGVEDTVMNTVRTWHFKPATRDGVAVASIQGLRFHYVAPRG
jgi:periplasmic protein TonB